LLVAAGAAVVRCSHNPPAVGSIPTRPTSIMVLTRAFVTYSGYTGYGYGRRDMKRPTAQDGLWPLGVAPLAPGSTPVDASHPTPQNPAHKAARTADEPPHAEITKDRGSDDSPQICANFRALPDS
jgi:hypothetical protein